MVCVLRVTAGETEALATKRRAGGPSWVIWTVLVPGGQPLGETTAVGVDAAAVDPAEFLAVTVTTSVWPTSLSVGTYDFLIAAAIVRQAPSASHRLHPYENVVGDPVQVPRVATSFWPTSAVPVMVGGVTFLGLVTLLAAAPVPGCPKTAPRRAPAATASRSPSLVRVRCLRSMSGSFGRSDV